MNKSYFVLFLIFLSLFFYEINKKIVFAESLALLAPARPHPDKNANIADNQAKNEVWETDILISQMDPFLYENSDMDIPQLFAVFEPQVNSDTGQLVMTRRDLLGDMEEIRYLDKKAWSANVALTHSGTHQFVLESKPWWDDKNQIFRQYLAKSMIVNGETDIGWDIPTGMPMDIVPLSRPYGVYSPYLFRGFLLGDGKPLENTIVHVGHINENRQISTSKWHQNIVVKTDNNGEFAAIFNQPGWWYCEATLPGEPLKGSDGLLKDLRRGIVLWLYVDPINSEKKKR